MYTYSQSLHGYGSKVGKGGNMIQILGTILIGASGTAIGAFFQNRAKKNLVIQKTEERELTQAQKLFDALSLQMDTRLYAMRRVYWAIKFDSIDEKEVQVRWDRYQDILIAWNNALNQNLSMIQRYFGPEMYKEYQTKIQKGFSESHSLLRNYYSEVDQRNGFDHGKFKQVVDPLNETFRLFNLKMVDAIQNSNIGILRNDLQSEEK